MIPEISVSDLALKLKSDEDFILLDVREAEELTYAKIADRRVLLYALSRLAREGPAALPDNLKKKDEKILVICHHGNRSAQVTHWLIKQGWTNVVNVAGGIDEYAREVDPSVGLY
jgi:rhodanese-related sulfurtransferase